MGKFAILVAVALIGFLQYKLWFGAGGLKDVRALQQQLTVLVEKNKALEARNEALAAEVRDLRDAHASVSERAREELGLVGEGEVFYQVIEHDKSHD